MPQGAQALSALLPPVLQVDLAVVLAALPSPSHQPLGYTRLILGGDEIAVPGRIYNPPLIASRGLSETQKRIVDCIYTRHHDGRVRELSVLPLIDKPKSWMAPFIVMLLGEYVVEIALTIAAGLERLGSAATREVFAPLTAENPRFMQLTEQRAISYWNCYYRGDYPVRSTYPAIATLRLLQEG
ncbi:MAG: hypothetical protein M3443_19525 [Actinomycetota bacterium]|nr:hypothetical protein [Actinomycetota bacterium]